jgi:hypothetical protein
VSTLQVSPLPPQQVIHIQPQAPAKPALGKPCNGCGICCLAEPCPLGVLLSRSRAGPCKALVWVEGQQQYRCGALGDGSARPGLFVNGLALLRKQVLGRWIAAGAGCDCDLDTTSSSTIGAPNTHQEPPAP